MPNTDNTKTDRDQNVHFELLTPPEEFRDAPRINTISVPASEGSTYVPNTKNIASMLETEPCVHTANPECVETAQLVEPVRF